MGLPSMTPVLGILDDCDSPEPKMLVVVYGHPSRPCVEYINPKRRPLQLRGRMAGFPRLFTPLAKFGMEALFEEDGVLQIKAALDGECTATYPDGLPRRWQGGSIGATEIKPLMAGHVMKAVQAMRAEKRARSKARREARAACA